MTTRGAYKRRKEGGLCVNCGTLYRPRVANTLMCQVCQDKSKTRRVTKEQRRNNSLKHHYGVDNAFYKRLYESQKGICPVCGLPLAPVEDTFRNCIDHKHKTGDIRGILHKGCNLLVGFADNPLAERAIEYARSMYCDAGFDMYPYLDTNPFLKEHLRQ